MRFTVVTYGSEGDTRPLVEVCLELMARGHQVRLWAERSTLASAAQAHVPHAALDGDIRAATDEGGALRRLMRRGDNVGGLLHATARLVNHSTGAWMTAVMDDARNSDAVLFASLASYVGLSVAEAYGLPAIGLGLWPIAPTSEFPSPLMAPGLVPRCFAKLSHRTVNGQIWRLFRDAVNQARRAHGLAPRRHSWDGYPVAYGISPALVRPPHDWPERLKMCGAWTSPEPEGWQPPPDLLDFLADGPKPLYFGFGSMAGFDSGRMLAAVIDAAQGRRAVFFPGWSGIRVDELPSNFRVVGPLPHQWLFPRMAVVVHHGGAGTSHTAARAGVPWRWCRSPPTNFSGRIGCVAPVWRRRRSSGRGCVGKACGPGWMRRWTWAAAHASWADPWRARMAPGWRWTSSCVRWIVSVGAE